MGSETRDWGLQREWKAKDLRKLKDKNISKAFVNKDEKD